MVPLEHRLEFLQGVDKNFKLATFYNFLKRKSVPAVFDEEVSSEINMAFLGIINSISNNDKEEFNKHYSPYSRRRLQKSSQAPFVNDDFFIFCVVIGVIIFDIDQDWIKKVLSVRPRTETTITFENILVENYQSLDNNFALVACALDRLSKIHLHAEVLIKAYNEISSNVNLFSKSHPFHIICSLYAYDRTIELRDGAAERKLQLLQHFEDIFLKRVSLLNIIIYNVLLIGLTFAFYKVLSKSEAWKEKAELIALVFGMVGISFANTLDKAKKGLKTLILTFLGYPKVLRKI